MPKFLLYLTFIFQLVLGYLSFLPRITYASPSPNQIEIPIELEVPGGGPLGDGQYNQAMGVKIKVYGHMIVNGVDESNAAITIHRTENSACNIAFDPYIFYNPCSFIKIPDPNFADTKDITLFPNSEYATEVTDIWHIQTGQRDSSGYIKPLENTNPFPKVLLGKRASKIKFEWSPNLPIKAPLFDIRPSIIKQSESTIVSVGELDSRADYILKVFYTPGSNDLVNIGEVHFSLTDDGKSCQFKTTILNGERNDLGAVCDPVTNPKYALLATLSGKQLVDRITEDRFNNRALFLATQSSLNNNQPLNFKSILSVYKKGDATFPVFNGIGGTITVNPDSLPILPATLTLDPASVTLGEPKNIIVTVTNIPSSNPHQVTIQTSGNPLIFKDLVSANNQISIGFSSSDFNTPGNFPVSVKDQVTDATVAQTGTSGSSPHLEVKPNPAGPLPGPGQYTMPSDNRIRAPVNINVINCNGKGCTSSAGQTCDNQEGVLTAIGCIHTRSDLLVKDILRLSVFTGGGIAFLIMVWGAIQMITSTGSAEALKAGQDRFVNAIIGLLFIVFSTLFLRIIGVDVLDFGRFLGVP